MDKKTPEISLEMWEKIKTLSQSYLEEIGSDWKPVNLFSRCYLEPIMYALPDYIKFDILQANTGFRPSGFKPPKTN